ALLGQDGDGGAAGHSLLGIEVVGRDVDSVHGLGRRNVLRVVREEDVDVDGAVETGVVVVSSRAVDVRGERAARSIGDGVLEPRGCRPGYQVEEALVVAVAPERQARDLLGLQLGREGARPGSCRPGYRRCCRTGPGRGPDRAAAWRGPASRPRSGRARA